MTDAIPLWLVTARTLKGTDEVPGSLDNPTILGWSDVIARTFPDLASYAKEYNHDSIAWCGQFVAYCMAANGIRPPSRPAAQYGYLWARDWAKWGAGLLHPTLGCVMVFNRAGGAGHVAFYERETDTHYYVTGGNQSDTVSTTAIPKSQFVAARWPSEVQTGTSPMSSGKGSWYSWYTGKYVWRDDGDPPNSNALGVPDDQQGFALYDRSTLGDWFDVTAPNGVTLRLQQTDIGPHPRTGRLIDIAAVAAERFGYTPKNFPTDSIFSWQPAGAVVTPPVVQPPVVLPPVIMEPPIAANDLDRVLDFIARNREDIRLFLRFIGLAGQGPAPAVNVDRPEEPSKAATVLAKPSVVGSAGVAVAAATAQATGALPPPTDLLTALPLIIPAVTALVGGMGGWTALAGFAASVLQAASKK